MASPAENAAIQQDIAADRLSVATALAVQRARISPPEGGVPMPPATLAPVIEAGIFAALIAMASSSERQVAAPTRVDRKALQDKATELEPQITDRVWEAAVEHAKTAPVDTDREFSRALARSSATRVAAESAQAVGDELGMKFKVWVSRGDEKVRASHRALHGKVVEIGKPFKRFSGGRLDYPGDTRAPIGEWINCRCLLFMSPTKAGVAEALAPADLDKAFALAASLEQRWLDDND